MDSPGADRRHGPSKADRTTGKAAGGIGLGVEGGRARRPPEGVGGGGGGGNKARGGTGEEPVWFEHSAYERAEYSYQRWLADQGSGRPAGGSGWGRRRANGGGASPRGGASSGGGVSPGGGVIPGPVQAKLLSAGGGLPGFDPTEPHPSLELWYRPIPLAPGSAPASGPAPKRRSRSGQPRPDPERRKEAWAEKPPPPHDPAEPAGHAHGRGRAPWRRGGAQRGRGPWWHRKRWSSEGDGGSPWQQFGARPSSMSGVQCLAQERIWFDKPRYDDAERLFYEGVNGPAHAPQGADGNAILQDIARARENIQKSLAGLKTAVRPSKSTHPARGRHVRPATMQGAGDQDELVTRMRSLELENQSLQSVVQDLRSVLFSLESRVSLLERTPVQTTSVQQPKVRAPVEEDDDDDLDLFGSDEDDAEAERIREERVKAYSEKKAKKPALIAKSSILLDVKPWDDETDMARLEECVRSVQADGLLWGSSKLVPVGYGIKKLQIACVVEDDKVGTDMLEEEITKFEDYVQSVDVAAFNKI